MNITIKNRIVSNDDVELGKIEGDTCSLLQPVGPAIKSGISKAHGSKLKFALIDAPSGLDGQSGSIGPVGSIGSIGAVGEPERNPLLGDKCPKLIAWKASQKGGK